MTFRALVEDGEVRTLQFARDCNSALRYRKRGANLQQRAPSTEPEPATAGTAPAFVTAGCLRSRSSAHGRASATYSLGMSSQPIATTMNCFPSTR